MTLSEITAITLESHFFAVLSRLIDLTLTPEGEAAYEIAEQIADESMYDRTTLNVAFTKPLLSDMEAELVIFKQELTDTENARLAEKARLDDLDSRFNAIGDRDGGFPSFHKLALGSNPAAYYRDSIKAESDPVVAESRMAAIEAQEVLEIAEMNATKYIEDRKKEYPTTDELIVALWEGDQSVIDALETKRQATKTKYPKS